MGYLRGLGSAFGHGPVLSSSSQSMRAWTLAARAPQGAGVVWSFMFAPVVECAGWHVTGQAGSRWFRMPEGSESSRVPSTTNRVEGVERPSFRTIQNGVTFVASVCMEFDMCRVTAYYRVSTEGQGRSGLGLEAQRQAVRQLCEGRGWDIVAEFTEVESGKRSDRPKLQSALDHARLTGSKLVVAKLDRLSRDAAFTLQLRNSGVDFTCADNPDVNRLTIGLLAVINEDERERISERTKAALAAAKARGQRLGNPNGAAALRRAGKGNAASVVAIKGNADAFAEGLRDTVGRIRSEGTTSLAGIAAELNARHMRTARGGKWHASSVRNLLARLAV